MHLSKPNSLHKLCIIFCMTLFIASSGCSKGGSSNSTHDETVPENVSWNINSVLNLRVTSPDPLPDTGGGVTEWDMGVSPIVDPNIKFAYSNGSVHMAYYDANPDYDPTIEDDSPYRVMYSTFRVNEVQYIDAQYVDRSNTSHEIITLLEDDYRNLGGLSVSVIDDRPIVAYSVFKQVPIVEGADLNNQGDVMIAIRDGENNWRNEIGAYGYVAPERNPVFTDGLAKSNFSLLGDGEGNALLCFQFYYEGIDSYNFDYPDLRFVSQPVDAFINDNVNAVADLEETVEGNLYQGGGGVQSFHGGECDLILDTENNPVVFYFNDDRENGSEFDMGLRFARKLDDEWQEPEWVREQIEVVGISSAVKSNGLLAVTYTVKDGLDLFTQEEVPYGLWYSEQVEVVVGETDEGEDIIVIEWNHEPVNYNTISGRYCTLAINSEDNPVVAYFDEMNFVGNRFFSRIKISSRDSAGNWSVDIITPEDVGLSNDISPYDITPGAHDSYYIGKYNYMWLDEADRVYLCTYSSITNKTYFFQQLNVD